MFLIEPPRMTGRATAKFAKDAKKNEAIGLIDILALLASLAVKKPGSRFRGDERNREKVKVNSALKAGDSDWARVDALTDEQVDAAIAADPDAAPGLDEAWFAGADLVIPAKVATSIRVDGDVIQWFRGRGRGWQTRMNAVLRAYAKAHGGVK